MYQHIIRSYTHLPGIGKFCHRNSSCCYFDICIAFNNAGTFAAEFQCNRYQFFSSHFINDLSNNSAAGIKNMIKCKIIHHFRNHSGPITLYIQNIFFGKSFFNDLFHHRIRCRCKFAWFKYNTISGCNGADQWID